MDEFVFKCGFENMDFEKVTAMLTESYWVKGIKLDEVIQGGRNSAFNAGIFTQEGKQIGYARVISDKLRFAYVLDVIIDENYRGRGLGQKIMKYMMEHEEMKLVYQWLLITRDAHGVYEKVGYKPVARPNDWMEVRKERPVR